MSTPEYGPGLRMFMYCPGNHHVRAKPKRDAGDFPASRVMILFIRLYRQQDHNSDASATTNPESLRRTQPNASGRLVYDL